MKCGVIGRIRRGLRRGESGQAFTELAVSLIAIVAVFVGLLLVAALGSDGVSTVIKARENADQRSLEGRYSSLQGGGSIRDWNRGDDGILFTRDDNPVNGSYGDGAYFKGQLADNTGHVMLYNPPGSSRLESEFSQLQDSNFFVNAASLSEGEARVSDTLATHNLSSLESAFQWLFGLNGTTIEDSVYIPAHKDIRNYSGEY